MEFRLNGVKVNNQQLSYFPSISYNVNWMASVHIPIRHILKISDQINRRGKGNERLWLKFHASVIQRTRKNWCDFYIIANNFCSHPYFCIKFAQLLYFGRMQMSWKFQVGSILVARYIDWFYLWYCKYQNSWLISLSLSLYLS